MDFALHFSLSVILTFIGFSYKLKIRHGVALAFIVGLIKEMTDGKWGWNDLLFNIMGITATVILILIARRITHE